MSKKSPADPAIPLINSIEDECLKQSLMSIFLALREELARRANGKTQLKTYSKKLKEELDGVTTRYNQLLQDHLNHQERVTKLIKFSQKKYPKLFLEFTEWLKAENQSLD